MRIAVLLSFFFISFPCFAACEQAETAEIAIISYEQLQEVDSGCGYFLAGLHSAGSRACSEQQEIMIRRAAHMCEDQARKPEAQL